MRKKRQIRKQIRMKMSYLSPVDHLATSEFFFKIDILGLVDCF
jgi:hypothetical protein